jgi:DNA-directed RNA polymerase specialized sigma24 family protein
MTKKSPKKKTTQLKKKTNKKTNLPNNVTEEEFLTVLDNISKRLANKFKFAYHSFEDMKQQAAIFALEGLEKYDNNRPLENFLWTHVRNRLFNYKRNNYQRPDKPCFTCPLFDKDFKCSNNQCSKFTNKQDCEPYAAWSHRNETKKNIIQPAYIEDDNQHTSKYMDISSLIQNQEIIQFLDTNITNEYREYYLKLKHGIKISKQHLNKLQHHILKLMENTRWKTNLFHENEDN